MAKTVKAFVRLNGKDYEVEVVSVFVTGDHRKVAVVEALPVNGKKVEPFSHYSVGGGYNTSSANIRVEFLKGLSIVEEPEQPAPAPVPAAPVPVDPPVYVEENGQDIPVEVLNVYTGVWGEKIAEVKALPVNGQKVTPFTNYSSSRWTPKTDTTRTQVQNLKGYRGEL